MTKSFFQVGVSVEPLAHGQAHLTPVKALKGLNYRFVAVKEGGDEAIVVVEGSDAELKALEKDKSCRKLTPKQAASLRQAYPALKLKKKFRASAPGVTPVSGPFETDEHGKPIVDTVQTVRSGFYLIDVPLESE
jgi:hypothetical protein